MATQVKSTQKLNELSVNTIRFLAVDAVQKANSGHPGLPMGAAVMAYTLWTLIAKLNDLIWDHYEEDFIQYQKQEVVYSGSLNDHLDNDDF